jgi:signal peptidase II
MRALLEVHARRGRGFGTAGGVRRLRRLRARDGCRNAMKPRFRPFALAGLIVLLDRATKWWIESGVSEYDAYTVLPGLFQIVHTRNRGIAFGLFNDGAAEGTSVVLIVLSLAILGFIGSMLWHYSAQTGSEHWTLRYGLGAILGGALGNIYDRIVFGSVTDFLDFFRGAHHFPVFNLADSAITCGAGLLLLNLLLAPGRPGGGRKARAAK